MEQKRVELISFELTNARIIKAVKLDFDKWKDTNVLEVVGDMGNGKSTLLENLATATTGASHIKDKDLLELGFKTEVQLADGDHKIFLGVKVDEISKGKNKGDLKFETYLYEKDLNGKLIQNPVIDGVRATPKEYTDLLSTALTFRMDQMFSENQKTHRELVTELFAKELHELGVEELLDSIKEKKEARDNARFDCERNSAFKEHFKTEGYSEVSLEALKPEPLEKLQEELKTLEVEKGVILKNPEDAKQKRLDAIKEEGRKVVSEVRKLNEKREKEYKDWKVLADAYEEDQSELTKFTQFVSELNIPESVESKIFAVSDEWTDFISIKHEALRKEGEKKEPILIPIEDDVIDVTLLETIPEAYKNLMKKRREVLDRYKKEKDTPIDLSKVDTKDVDAKIEAKNKEIASAEANNSLIDRYNMWQDWIEKKGIYEKEVDTLRKLYTKIDTGVEGLFIQPHLTDTGKLEIWLEYNASHDPVLFKNDKKELRRLYEYSKSQRAITGVLLQAARLDKKGKALRLAVLDDYTQTKAGKALLEKVCKERDLKLVIAKTSDEYDLKKLGDGTFVVENGEILLG